MRCLIHIISHDVKYLLFDQKLSSWTKTKLEKRRQVMIMTEILKVELKEIIKWRVLKAVGTIA